MNTSTFGGNNINFKSWQENVMIVLGVMDLNLTLMLPSPTPLTDKSCTDEKRDMKRWEKSNLICIMIMKRAFPEAFKGTMSKKITTAKEFLEDIEKKFAKNKKAETSTLLTNLISMRYKGKWNIREYIMKMSHITSKLQALKLELSEDLLLLHIMKPCN
ncbi:uncharacterized protein LOC109838150 [Asparagus officinalis]|uniref:uncharacterized protein LOC109838150 n=1 Tax=Asparagus officinalis TaxID=4686 RepID=UPI00098E560A|nr:uncharacterized protein LOC109838150 [Asparagus officinalis]